MSVAPLSYGELLEQLAAHSPTLRHVCNATLYPPVTYSSAPLASYANTSERFTAQLTCTLVRLTLMMQLSVLDFAVVACWFAVSLLVLTLPYILTAAVCFSLVTTMSEASRIILGPRLARVI